MSKVDDAFQLGCKYEKEYGNCSRCTAIVLQQLYDEVPQSPDVIKSATALSGGATTYRNANCGAFTGAGIVLGAVYGAEDLDADNREAKKAINAFFKKFHDQYGTVICKELKLKGAKCDVIVGNACKWAAEVLEENKK